MTDDILTSFWGMATPSEVYSRPGRPRRRGGSPETGETGFVLPAGRPRPRLIGVVAELLGGSGSAGTSGDGIGGVVVESGGWEEVDVEKER